MDGPICRSANQLAAMGAPAPIISSAMMIRSMPGRPPPPCSTGHVIPMNPSAASTLENSLEWPLIHESWNRPYSATPCSATARARAPQLLPLGPHGEVEAHGSRSTSTGRHPARPVEGCQ